MPLALAFGAQSGMGAIAGQGISVNTLYSWVSQMKIDYVKIGRLTKFDLKVIDKYIENNSVEAVN